LAQTAATFCTRHLGEFPVAAFDFEREIRRFWEIFRHPLIRDNSGGSGFHNAFWIYVVSRLMNPDLIVESGVWKGQTSWLLEQACPQATIHGFDLDLGPLEFRTGKVLFHQQDWSEYEFPQVDGNKALVFFDCHVSHARRIREAGRNGFRHVLLDDNWPAHKLYAGKQPPFPTAHMIVHALDPDTREITWSCQDARRTHLLEWSEMREVRRLVQTHEVFPDVGGPTKYGGFAFLTYVKLAVPGGAEPEEAVVGRGHRMRESIGRRAQYGRGDSLCEGMHERLYP